MTPLGAVLAGGRGSRLGGRKATAEVLGRPLLDWTLEALLLLLPSRRSNGIVSSAIVSADEEELFLPRLRHLRLRDVYFAARPHTQDDETYLVYWMDRLRVRRERGGGLETLKLQHCYNVTEELVREIGCSETMFPELRLRE